MTDATQPDTTPETITITTLRTDQCPSLSGRSALTYELGNDPEGRLHLRVTHNTGKGHHNPSWVAYDAVEPLLMAVLKHLGVLQAVTDKRHAYQYVEGVDWKARLQASSPPAIQSAKEPTHQPTTRPVKDDKARSKRAGASAAL